MKFCNTIDYIRSKVIDNRKITVMLDIDFRKSLVSRDYAIPSDYIRLFNYIIDFCSKNNIEFGTQEFQFTKHNFYNNNKSGAKTPLFVMISILFTWKGNICS